MVEDVILMVEDNPKDEMLIKRSLAQANITNEILVARDGAEAVEILFAEKDRVGGDQTPLPTLVLLDLKLPKLSGHEVLQRIRSNERTKLLPVIILTSSDEEIDIVKSYEAGANSYVRKPVKFDDFAKCISDLGLYWTVTNTSPPLWKELTGGTA